MLVLVLFIVIAALYTLYTYFDVIEGLLNLITVLITIKLHSLRYSGKRFSYLDVFEAQVDAHRNREQFIDAETGTVTTLGEVEALANQVGVWALSQGLKSGDTAALMMLNSPDFVAIWLGIGKCGGSTALINTSLTGAGLVHCVDLAVKNNFSSKIFVVDMDLKDQIAADIDALERLGVTIYFWSCQGKEDSYSVKEHVVTLPSTRVNKLHRDQVMERDPFLYIYTSGTTGLPKAGKISHTRYYFGGLPYYGLCGLNSYDRVYLSLPFYHSSAGLMGVGAALISGATVVFRQKFSASRFVTDCVKYHCTSMQYIGELCRYLLATPVSEEEGKLCLRTAMGNGLREDCWMQFKDRFRIGKIFEFYAATEGNAGLFNFVGKVGAIGFIPRIIDFIYPVKIIRTDPDDKSMPYRNSDGFCELCDVGEVGLLVGFIGESVDRRFDGYSDELASKKKVLNDVFQKGDSFFNTGDLMFRDWYGFFFWSDRTGDTFRWKGENVATTEIEKVYAMVEGIQDNTVYGVTIPRCDGRAGMAAIVLKSKDILVEDVLVEICKQSKLHLPPYARPLFIRIRDSLKTTTTFKHVKGDLVKEVNSSFFDCNTHSLVFHYCRVSYQRQLMGIRSTISITRQIVMRY